MANNRGADFHFSIIDIQTVSFTLPADCWTLDRNRRFFVSVTDGKITKHTRVAVLDLQPLHWTENLDGFIVDSSSQIILRVFEKHHVRKNNLLATFFISYEVLHSSRNAMVQCVDDSKKKKTPSREINVIWSENRTSVVEEARSRLQTIEADALKMHTAGLAAGLVVVSDSHVGQVLDTTGKVVTSMQGFLAKWKDVSDQLGFVVRAVDAIAELHPYAKIALSVISFIPKMISEQIQLDKAILDLLNDIGLALDLAPDEETLRSRCRKSDRHEKTLTRLLTQITECGHFIQSYVRDVNFGKRLLKNLLSNGKTATENFQQTLKKLRDDFLSEVIVNVEINVFRILAEAESISEGVRGLGKDIKEVKEKVERVDENIKAVDITVKLQKLPYGQGTDFDPERGCLPQTRDKILDEIVGWVNDPSSPQVLLLFGQAGTGKSSIAHEIARRFRHLDELATSYCFVRGKPSSRDCYRFFTTLAHNLCIKYPAFRIALSKIISNNPGLVEMQAYTALFETLLRDPLKDIFFIGPVFIVVDALDESEDASEVQRRDTLAFHEFLATRLSELPPNFRILITSRPEPDLERAFSDSSSFRRLYMNDSKLTAGLDDDMLIYVRTKLRKAKGVDEDDIQKLVKKAEGNFQWAFVACSHIAKPPSGLDSRRCIQRVLKPDSGMALNPLDELYTTILKRFDMNDRDVCNNFKSVMGQILGAFEPLSVDALDVFVSSKDDESDVSAIVEDLGSVLSHVTRPESALPIAPLHTSFRDFLTDETRSGIFHVNLDNIHEELALATLRTMQAKLEFNICKFDTSYLLNSEVPDLAERVEANISLALSYSCGFWADHLRCVSMFNSGVFESLQVLMKERYLFWLEVLSVRGQVPYAQTALLSMRGWLSSKYNEVDIEELDALAKDAIAFVGYFGYLIAQSAPHIYLSALPFSPSSSIISHLYTPKCNTIRLERGKLTEWPALELSITTPDEREVCCVAWSGDGEYIAAGVGPNGYVWSTSTGMKVSAFRVENDSNSTCVTFSHDGQQIAFGSWSGMIWIWDVMKGTKTKVTGPWIPVAVSAVAFGYGDTQLVLGLYDCRIFVWDLEKAEVVGEPFIGHNNPVWAVSFLYPQEFLSRSGFRTARIWNVVTRESVTMDQVPTGTIDSTAYSMEDLIRDRSRVKSSFKPCSWPEAESEEKYLAEGSREVWSPVAAFSTNWKLVATCNLDYVHVWFAKGGMAGGRAGGPFSSEGGICLAFSADGQRIACGTSNGILRVWKIQLVFEEGTESSTRRLRHSVAFMPSSERIVVGWTDGRVELLDASTGQEVVKIMEGEDDYGWNFVAVSLDGARIASARNDELYIWTGNGEAIAGPLASGDKALTFSPDSNNLVVYSRFSGLVSVLNASTGVFIAGPKNFNSSVNSLALSPSISTGSTTMETRVAVGADAGIFIWDIMTGNVAAPFTHNRYAYAAALVFSSDGKYVTSATSDYTICVWDSLNGKAVRGPVEFRDRQKVNLARPCSAALTLDGRRVAFTGTNNTILLFDVVYKGDSDVELHNTSVLAGDVGGLNFLAFSPDGQYLATTSDDRTIRRWDLQGVLGHKQVDRSNDFQVNLDETWIDHDGWARCANGDGGNSALRLAWIPEVHRVGLCRSSNMRVVSGEAVETQLDLENFCHGKNWVKCWRGHS